MKPSRKSLMSVLFFVLSSSAVAAENYQLTISNGSAMPISPPAIYFMNGSMGISELGTTATPGFIKICQSGDSSGLLAEVSSNPSSAGSGALKNQILPGQKRTVLIRTSHPQQHSVHIVAMYGKTKDVCAVIKISSDDLTALAEGRVKEINRVDQVVSTGAL